MSVPTSCIKQEAFALMPLMTSLVRVNLVINVIFVDLAWASVLLSLPEWENKCDCVNGNACTRLVGYG